MSQTHDLHRALLRPAIIHTLRAVGFHSTKPSVLDTLVNIAERHLQLLASTTARHAQASHNDPIPTVSDVRMALADCGSLIPLTNSSEEGWRERLRMPLSEITEIASKQGGGAEGGRLRMLAEKRKREEEDTVDVREFVRWFDGPDWRETKRVAGMIPDASTLGGAPAIGVGGGVVTAEDFLTGLKKKYGKGGGDESRWVGTALGTAADDKVIVIDGGPFTSVRDWRPKMQDRTTTPQRTASNDNGETVDSGEDEHQTNGIEKEESLTATPEEMGT